MADPSLYYEAGQTYVAATALSDSGDHTIFNSAVNFWSGRAGYAPVMTPNGIVSGGAGIPAVSGSNNVVDVAQVICYLAGVKTTVSADTDIAITRGSTKNYTKHSLTITSLGAFAMVDGTEGDAHSDTRGAAGGPPWIPTGSVEVFQVHITNKTAAPVTAAEIFSVPGTHKEMALFPTFSKRNFSVSGGALGYAGLTFDAALPLIHSDDAGSTTATKKVYVQYYTPTFAQISKSSDFKRPANSVSISSQEYYGGAQGKKSTSLGTGGFKALTDTLTEGVLAYEGENLLFKFYPDRLNTDYYVVAQGYLGVGETFETDGKMSIDCVIAAEAEGNRVTA